MNRTAKFSVVFALACLLLLQAAQPVCADFSIVVGEVKEGRTLEVIFENHENENVSLAVTNISWPLSAVPLFIGPTTILENTSQVVSIHFIALNENQRRQVSNGRYAVKLSGGGDEMLVYLVVENSLVGYVPENFDNMLSNLENRYNILENRFNNLNTALALLRENITIELNNIKAALENLRSYSLNLNNEFLGLRENYTAELLNVKLALESLSGAFSILLDNYELNILSLSEIDAQLSGADTELATRIDNLLLDLKSYASSYEQEILSLRESLDSFELAAENSSENSDNLAENFLELASRYSAMGLRLAGINSELNGRISDLNEKINSLEEQSSNLQTIATAIGIVFAIAIVAVLVKARTLKAETFKKVYHHFTRPDSGTKQGKRIGPGQPNLLHEEKGEPKTEEKKEAHKDEQLT